jgi:hypothetical protein
MPVATFWRASYLLVMSLRCLALPVTWGMFRLGIQTALLRRASEGGSWEVVVSLAETGKWIRELGRVDLSAFERTIPSFGDVQEEGLLNELIARDGGKVTFLRHAANIENSEVGWAAAPGKLGSDEAEWFGL